MKEKLKHTICEHVNLICTLHKKMMHAHEEKHDRAFLMYLDQLETLADIGEDLTELHKHLHEHDLRHEKDHHR